MSKEICDLSTLKFGDTIINGYAGKGNPHKVGVFVELKKNTRTNRFGITHTERLIRVRHSDGKFSNYHIDILKHPDTAIHKRKDV